MKSTQTMPSKHWETHAVMTRVALALLPCVAVSSWVLGPGVLLHGIVCIASGAVFETLCRALSLRSGLRARPGAKQFTLPFGDMSTPVTGLLIALALPPTAPLWIGIVAVGIAIVLAKELFGGLGRNVFNPAMAGYAAVLVSYPQALVYTDAVSGATALDLVSHRGGTTLAELAATGVFGSFAVRNFEWINAAALLGGLYLMAVRIVHWRIPVAVLLGIGLPALIGYDDGSSASFGSPLLHWFAGGTMLAAFFIATDPVTAPTGKGGQWLFGLIIGGLIFVIRAFGAYPDGIAFAVLLGNLLTAMLHASHGSHISGGISGGEDR